MSLCLYSDKVTVKRQSNKGEYSGGFPVDPLYSTFENVECSVQPLSGRERRVLDANDRLKDTIFLISEFEFVENDLIEWRGREYEALIVEPWHQLSIAHYEVTAVVKDT